MLLQDIFVDLFANALSNVLIVVGSAIHTVNVLEELAPLVFSLTLISQRCT